MNDTTVRYDTVVVVVVVAAAAAATNVTLSTAAIADSAAVVIAATVVVMNVGASVRYHFRAACQHIDPDQSLYGLLIIPSQATNTDIKRNEDDDDGQGITDQDETRDPELTRNHQLQDSTNIVDQQQRGYENRKDAAKLFGCIAAQ